MTELTPPKAGEQIVTKAVRFRTVGDITCTAPVASDAANVDEIIEETLIARLSERGLELGRIHVERGRADVEEDRHQAVLKDRVYRRREAGGDGDDLVARPEPALAQ